MAWAAWRAGRARRVGRTGEVTRLRADIAAYFAAEPDADLAQTAISRVHADAPARLGELAPLVTRAAIAGDPVAVALVDEAAERLVAAVRTVATAVPPLDAVDLVLAGALLIEGPVRAAVISRLDADCGCAIPVRARPAPRRWPWPSWAAARSTRRCTRPSCVRQRKRRPPVSLASHPRQNGRVLVRRTSVHGAVGEAGPERDPRARRGPARAATARPWSARAPGHGRVVPAGDRDIARDRATGGAGRADNAGGLLVAHRGDRVGRLGGRQQRGGEPLGLGRVVAGADRDGHVAPGDADVLGRLAGSPPAARGSPGTAPPRCRCRGAIVLIRSRDSGKLSDRGRARRRRTRSRPTARAAARLSMSPGPGRRRPGRRAPPPDASSPRTAARTGSSSEVVQTTKPSTAASVIRGTSSAAPVIGRIVMP